MAEKIKYSKEQEQIIYSNEKSLLVSASAGSGKTKVLVERIVDLIVNKNADIKNMLVVTFTKLASLEMKARLKAELEKLEKTDRVLNQLDALNTANISTLHKFCEVVIKEYFYEAQVDPSFTVLEGAEEKYLKDIALNKIIENYSQKNDEDFETLFEVFYENRSDETFKENIINIYSFLLSKPKDYLQQTLKEVYSENIDDNLSIQYIINETKSCFDYFKKKFNSLLLDAESLNNEKLTNSLKQNISRIESLEKCGYFDLRSMYDNTEFETTSVSQKMSIEEKEICEKTKTLRNEFKAQFDKIVSCYAFSKDSLWGDFEYSKKMVAKFCEVVEEFSKEYSLLKLAQNKLDFNDLEKYLLKILENKKIREGLQEKYKYIFVDEYQDTNLVQEQIIENLTKDNYVFMVGDVKQSIYMFRECNPQIFINKSEKLASEKQSQVVLLNRNYRSDKNILEFCNLVFNKIMTKQTAKLDYKTSSQLVFGETFKEQNLDSPKVNICLLKSQAKENGKPIPDKIYSVLEDNFEKESEKKIEKQAYLIAKKIAKLIDTEIYDKELDRNRKIEYRDIAILTRTGESIKKIAKVLSSLNIPINAEYKLDVFGSAEVQMLINILKLINNYQDDIALAGVMKSCAYNFSDYDLIEIKQSFDNKFFYQNVLDYLKKENELSKKLQKIFDDITYFKNFIMENSISTCVDEIVYKLNLEEKLYAFDNYVQALENIKIFTEIIGEVDNHNLTALIDYFDTLNKGYTKSINIKNGDNSVFIGTIHSSKGLEYPVVFADINYKFSHTSTYNKLLKNNELGFALDIYDTKKKTYRESITKNIFKLKILEQEKQEEMRLLYVALTRAQCYLYLIASYSKLDFENFENDYEIKHSQSYLEFILRALPENILTQLKNGKESIVFESNLSKFLIENITEFEIKNLSDEKKYNINTAFENAYLEYIDKKFEHTNYAFKNTVTALVEAEDDENYNIKDFKFSSRPKDEEDFLAIGTTYHKVMEKLDFDKPFDSQYEQIIKNEKLDESLLEKDKLKVCYDKISSLIDSGDIVLKEKQFMFYPKIADIISSGTDARVLIQGMVDLMIIKPDEIVLVDYKTSRISNENELKNKYKLQLDLYANAIEKFYKKNVSKKIIYSFYTNRLIIV